ncbi:hypothetical protein ACJJTC_006228 [Scirpophaga incertulas]
MTGRRDLIMDFKSRGGSITIASGDKLQCTGLGVIGKRTVEMFFPICDNGVTVESHAGDRPQIQIEAELNSNPVRDEMERQRTSGVSLDKEASSSSNTDYIQSHQEHRIDAPVYNLRSRLPKTMSALEDLMEVTQA